MREVGVGLRCGRCGLEMTSADGVRLHCIPCRSEIEAERRALAKCRRCRREPAIQTKNPRNKGFCADCLAAIRGHELDKTPLAREVERRDMEFVADDLVRIAKELGKR